MTTIRASIAIPRPVRRLFTYEVPEALLPACRRGVRVIVPFGSRRVTGYVLDLAAKPLPDESAVPLKQIEEVLDREPILDEPLLELTRWAAEYYVTAWGEMIRAALPGMRAVLKRELVLTPDGRAALESDPGDAAANRTTRLLRRPEAREILGTVAQYSGTPGRGLRVPDLRKHLGPRFSEAALARLRRDGLLREIDIPAAGTRAQIRETAHLNRPAPPIPPRGTRQRDVLRLLDQAPGGVEVQQLLRDSGASRAALRTLQERALVRIDSQSISRRPPVLQENPHTGPAFELSAAQETALRYLREAVAARQFSPCLLRGVTGSGKTEVYLRAIEATLKENRRALYLVPEIGLTPLLARRLQSRFEGRLALLHSGLSDGERHDEWHRIRAGRAPVVLGTRSAVFAPLTDLGIVIVDEEHDTSYKQDEYPRYNGRDLAIMRAKMSNAVVLLGSATPSMETYRWAEQGRYRLLTLPERVGGSALPSVECIDMRSEFLAVGRESVLSRRLATAIGDRLARGEQSLILLNRRGFSTFALCRACGEQIQCRRCSIGMTLYRRQQLLRCHYCDDQRRVPDRCPDCRSAHMHFGGTGTERLEDTLRARFPEARIQRMDRDTVSGRGAAERILTRVERGEIDILTGTQMIAKGHDFPNVSLVGVLGADAHLGLPDFRAGERTFQLLSQVAGRSGRRERCGEVIVQAYYADHHAIKAAARHDFEGFAREELRYRRVMNYPPFSAMALVLVRDRTMEAARRRAGALAQHLRHRKPAGLQVLGPAPAPLQRLRGRYRVQILLKGDRRRTIQAALADMLAAAERRRENLHEVIIDVDPMSTM